METGSHGISSLKSQNLGLGPRKYIIASTSTDTRLRAKGCLWKGGIFTGNQGTRFPRNLQTHTKFLQHFTLFWHKFDFKVRISCHLKKFFLSHTCMKYFLVTRRNFLALKLINCQRKKFIVTERNLLSRAEIYCHKKKFLVAGRNFLSQEEINFLS